MPEVPDTVDDAIEPLVSPSTDEVFEATRPFSAREIGSAAVSEALSGGGGGSQTLAEVLAEGNDAANAAIDNVSDLHADNVYLGQGGYTRAGDVIGNEHAKIQHNNGAAGAGGDLDCSGGDATDVDHIAGNVNLYGGVDVANGNGATIKVNGGDPNLAYSWIDAFGHLFLRGGSFIVCVNAAPGDDDISSGQAAIWFDKTNGAAKLKIKAKQANGTIVTGEIALAP